MDRAEKMKRGRRLKKLLRFALVANDPPQPPTGGKEAWEGWEFELEARRKELGELSEAETELVNAMTLYLLRTY